MIGTVHGSKHPTAEVITLKYLASLGDYSNYPAGSTLPYNYMTTYGSFLLELYKATGNATYRDKAAKLGRSLHWAMHYANGRYVWNYDDVMLSADAGRSTRLEDTPHANSDVA